MPWQNFHKTLLATDKKKRHSEYAEEEHNKTEPKGEFQSKFFVFSKQKESTNKPSKQRHNQNDVKWAP